MKKIGIYLSVGPYSGGSFQYCVSIINHLKKLNKKKYKIIAFISNKVWINYVPENFKIIRIKKKNLLFKFLNYLNFIILSNKLLKFINNHFDKNINSINKENCDIIIFPSQENLSSKIYAKSITSIHDLMHRYESKFKEYNFFEKIRRDYKYVNICKYSDKILVDSLIGKKHVIESYNVNPKIILEFNFEIPEYLKLKKKRNIFKKYNLPKDKFIFYPAQFWEHKNHINLIKAFKLVREKILNINLVLVGVEKNNLDNINYLIKKNKLENCIFILGYIENEDVYSFYKSASLMCYVSYCGPTNIPPLEAMYLGCPLICSNKYGMPNQVKNGALLVNPISPKDISKKILKILLNNSIRKKIVENGFKIMKKKEKLNFEKFLN